MASNITKTSLIGSHISLLFTGYYTDDQALLKARDWVNATIRNFKRRPATPENCRNLRDYIKEKMLEMYRRPWSKARNELLWQCVDRINTLNEAYEKLVTQEETQNQVAI